MDELCSRSSLHDLSDLLVVDGPNLLLIVIKFLNLECSRVRDQLEGVLVEGKVHAAAIQDSHLDGGGAGAGPGLVRGFLLARLFTWEEKGPFPSSWW